MTLADDVLAHVQDDEWWEDAPDGAREALAIHFTQAQARLAEHNKHRQGAVGSSLRKWTNDRAEIVAFAQACQARLTQLPKGPPPRAEWSGDTKSAVEAVKDLARRITDLEDAIRDHRDATHDDEIEPGDHDLDLWAVLD